MTAKRTVREIKIQADLMAQAMQMAQVDVDPVSLKMRLLAAVLQAESYKKLPQWRQACLQGFCEGLALGRGITAGVPVEVPRPAEEPLPARAAAPVPAAEPEPEAPHISETRSIRPPPANIEQLQELQAALSKILNASNPAPAPAPKRKTVPPARKAAPHARAKR